MPDFNTQLKITRGRGATSLNRATIAILEQKSFQHLRVSNIKHLDNLVEFILFINIYMYRQVRHRAPFDVVVFENKIFFFIYSYVKTPAEIFSQLVY